MNPTTMDDETVAITEKALGLREHYSDPEHYDRDFSARFAVERAKLEQSVPTITPNRIADTTPPCYEPHT